jgi:multisubunit Na+/H+ antiporter MnhB subunit
MKVVHRRPRRTRGDAHRDKRRIGARVGVQVLGFGAVVALLLEATAGLAVAQTLTLGTAVLLWVLANFATERPGEA